MVCVCAQSSPILWDSMDYSPPGSSVQGIFQERILEQVAVSFSRGSSWPRDQTWVPESSAMAGGFFTSVPPRKPRGEMEWDKLGDRDWRIYTEKEKTVKVKSLSPVRLFATPWTVAHQAPPSMGFSRQEYWSGLPFPSPEDLPNPEIEPGSPTL